MPLQQNWLLRHQIRLLLFALFVTVLYIVAFGKYEQYEKSPALTHYFKSSRVYNSKDQLKPKINATIGKCYAVVGKYAFVIMYAFESREC